MLWRSLVFTSLAALLLAVSGVASDQPVKTEAWLEDFAQLKQEMAVHYANLEWAIESRGLDLKQLSERAESRLRMARNEAEARQAIESFLGAFGDGHLYVQWSQSAGQSSQSASQLPLCAQLGYQGQTSDNGILFSRLDNFREITTPDSKYFPGGVLRLSNNKRVGVLRIALFSGQRFPDLCESVISSLGLAPEKPCEGDCRWRVQRQVEDRLTAALERQVMALTREKVDLLLVDITRNGGGSNWVEPATRTLSAKPLRSPRLGFIRHEHWARQMKDRLTDIESAIPQSTASQQKLLMRAAEATRLALAEARKPCDRTAVWNNEKPGCSLVVSKPPLYASGVLAYGKPGEFAGKPSLFNGAWYTYKEGIYSGPLIVLVDEGTASASEYFAAMLADNRAATIIGEPTLGAGCGYTNGGIPTVLKNSNGRVRMPDCVRFRLDGSNEVGGITPDKLIAWRSNDTRYQRAKRVLETLSELKY
jgi:hypothetical protein